jgi:predicted metal-dependent enzyme (double-stranded beta helix superfamily)
VASPKHSQELETFIAEIGEILRTNDDELEITALVATRMRGLLRQPLALDSSFTRPDPDGYVMYAVHVDSRARFSVAAAVWDVEQRTPIHDHGTWGVIGIVSGAEHEERYEATGGPPSLLEKSRLSAGDVKVCCTSDADIHAVSCASEVPCVGLHVYGGDIGALTRHSYNPSTGVRTPFVSSWGTLRPVTPTHVPTIE